MPDTTTTSTRLAGAARGLAGRLAAAGLFALALGLLAFPASSGATFPGASGAIVFSQVDTVATPAEDGDGEGATTPAEPTKIGGLVAARGGDLNQLTYNPADSQPAVAPDGDTIVFVRNGDLFSIRVDGSGQRHLTSGPDRDSSPQISPNGRLVLFERRAPGAAAADLYTVKANGHGVKALAASPDDERDAVFSPDGRAVAFVRTTADNDDIYSIRPNGSGLVRLTWDALDDFAPRYFAGGIVFDRGIRADDPSAYADLYTMRRNGSRQAELAGGPGSEYVRDVSPDGRRILFSRDQGIWTKRIGGRGARKLKAIDDATQMTAAFSPDGRRAALYVGAESSDVVSTIRIRDSREAVLARAFHGEFGAGTSTIGPDFAWQPIQRCRGRRATIVGTPGNDLLRGTPGPDVIVALAGNDRVYAGGGRDVVCGGPGRDRIHGQRGKDVLVGGPGRDRIS